MAMKIGLLDIDCHASKKKWGATVYPNIALGKIARWHKERGDDVEWATVFEHYDVLYMSKIFNWSEDDLRYYDAEKVVRGGTGYDIYSKLPDEVDRMQPDYSIYPHVPDDTAYGFLTRGCQNRCKWCVVPRKEGVIRPYMDVDEIAIEGRRKLVLMDNNILAAGEYAVEQMEKIIRKKYRVDFNQALDARLVDERFAKLLAKMKWLDRRIRFGCDTHGQIEECERAMSLINADGYKGEYFLYTMIGGENDFVECWERVNYWHDKLLNQRQNRHKNAVYAYAQPYRDPDNPHREIPQWQKDMANWCNKKQLFTTVEFKDFEIRQGFRCGEYFKTLT